LIDLAHLVGSRHNEARRRVNTIVSRLRPLKGRAAAISMHAIAAETEISTRDIQAIVKYLVEERHFPIGTAMSEPRGYFWIASEAERRAVRNHFIRRGRSVLEHARAYDSEDIVGPLLGQLDLVFKEEEQP